MNSTAKNAEIAKEMHRIFALLGVLLRTWRFNLLEALSTCAANWLQIRPFSAKMELAGIRRSYHELFREPRAEFALLASKRDPLLVIPLPTPRSPIFCGYLLPRVILGRRANRSVKQECRRNAGSAQG